MVEAMNLRRMLRTLTARIAPRRILSAVALAAVLLPYLILPVAAQTPAVQVLSEPGVPPDAAQDVQRGSDLSLQFFRETYTLELKRSVHIILVPDNAAYIAALIREFSVSQTEADRRARTTTGWTAGSTIIINVGVLSPRARIFLTAHELTHQLQMQVTAAVDPWRLYWLAEGTADAVAAHVVEMSGHFPVEGYRTSWLATVHRAERRPDLSGLNTRGAWIAALDIYGSSVTYRVAGLGALYLIERFGHSAILAYFEALGRSDDPTQAFQQAFGWSIDAFIEEFRTFLASQAYSVTRRVA